MYGVEDGSESSADSCSERPPNLNVLHAIRKDPKLSRHHLLITHSAVYQTFFQTPTWEVGMSPYSLEIGDKIAVVAGMRYPVVLRPSIGGESTFRLIGLAYLDSLVFGQQWPDNEDELYNIVLV